MLGVFIIYITRKLVISSKGNENRVTRLIKIGNFYEELKILTFFYSNVAMEINDTQSDLELGDVKPRWSNKRKPLQKQNCLETDVDDKVMEKKGQITAKKLLVRQKSWKLIDGTVDGINWSSNDGWWKWIMRIFSIANLLVIGVCFGLLISTCYHSLNR